MKKTFEFEYRFENQDWKQKILYWADRKFPFFALCSGNDYSYLHEPFGEFLFLGHQELDEKSIWEGGFLRAGIIGYDFKNQIEKLESRNPAILELPDLCFFKADWLLNIQSQGFSTSAPFPEDWLKEIESISFPENPNIRCKVFPQISRDEYIHHIQNIQQEILEGNTYEANFCQAYFGEFQNWDPIAAYLKLNQLSPMPFASLFKAEAKWLVSASPERFIKKTGKKLIAQPIKGTISRGNSPECEISNREKLSSSEKERAENLMITDLMRNDLARVSETGSVEVEELFGIYPLPRVFQMISTVSSMLREGVSLEEIIQATFPMGSMTGAPKIITMKILDREENFKRAWFSGAFGWIDEEGNFDFSVVIRSIIADLEAKKLYFGVGSAITIDASPEQEYEECALKAQAIIELLLGK
ncbi:anthranilate synthase component I family protein [Algoriphagus mannitolivorans]|uniref:anthranilate synthase component I family protein n=1 Tax=Algoriphagus mannitolivorans TaxID=226504 RepID=UPI00041334A5|nr:anthranilate synthase component I family protein [Algoriphagus mannitolivorans]